MNLLHLAEIIRNKEEAIRFLQQRNVVHTQRRCDNNHAMVLRLSDKEDRWRCNVRDCRQQKQLKSGTWLHGTHLTYRQAVMFIYCWSREYTTHDFRRKELEMESETTIVDWNNYMREVCAQVLLADPPRIGGVGLTVEIDESLYVRRKNVCWYDFVNSSGFLEAFAGKVMNVFYMQSWSILERLVK